MTRNISTGRHGQVRALVHREFVKTGHIPVELGEIFDRLFRGRLTGDYADFAEFDPGEVADWLEQARLFVSHVEGLLAEGSTGEEDGDDT